MSMLEVNGTRSWYNSRGERHRDGGAAVEYVDGTKIWFKNGRYHRLDGPAVEYAHGSKAWYVEGVQYYNESEYIEKLKSLLM